MSDGARAGAQLSAASVRSHATTSETIRAALARAQGALTAAGCDTPRLDAELLLAHALGRSRAGLYLELDRPLDPARGDRFATLVARRAAREPLAYLVGRRAFRNLVVHVDRRVLVPRPETELLVEAALELGPGAHVVDVGTGSGAVALAVKDERPDLRVTATDRSADALAVARANGRRLGLDVRWRRCDLLGGVEGPIDAVLANLPYVAEPELDELMPEVSGYEPRGALLGGRDGLALVRALCTQLAGARLVALEVGAGQAPAVRAMLGAAGFAPVEGRRDLGGIERVLVGRRT